MAGVFSEFTEARTLSSLKESQAYKKRWPL